MNNPDDIQNDKFKQSEYHSRKRMLDDTDLDDFHDHSSRKQKLDEIPRAIYTSKYRGHRNDVKPFSLFSDDQFDIPKHPTHTLVIDKRKKPSDQLFELNKKNFPVGASYPDGCVYIIPKINSNNDENLRLLHISSKIPREEKMVVFNRICDAYILGFITSNVWQISNYKVIDNQMTTALYDVSHVRKGIMQNKLYMFVDFGAIGIINYEGYSFLPRRILSNNISSQFPMLHSRFDDILRDHYNKIAEQLDYSYVIIRGKYCKSNQNVIFIEVLFSPSK